MTTPVTATCDSSEALSALDVLVVDCQATAAAPRGHLLELGWARAHGSTTDVHARLIALPEGENIPAAVTRITGISAPMAREGMDADAAWRELSDAVAAFAQHPAPTIIHFARFEQPFLRTLAGDALPFEIVCTHEIARRLLPALPRRSLRALTGYFGHGVGALRRSAEHVQATAFVWRELVRLLQDEGVVTWRALREWLEVPVPATKRRRRVWPMPRDVRLSVPDSPGVYRMLRTSGEVLYVGKAASLHQRVNSYFRKQSRVSERMLEMLSQARGISFERLPTTLEAALHETDEIKRHRPPYNVALTTDARSLWFTSPDLSLRASQWSTATPLGPFPSADLLDRFGALARADRMALASGGGTLDAETFEAGYARLCASHAELSRRDLGAHERLLRLGTRLWREGRRDHDVDEDDADRAIMTWTPELVQLSIEWLALRAAFDRRRAIWLTRLVDASVVWTEPGAEAARLIVMERGEMVVAADVAAGTTPPVPPGHARSVAARRAIFTLACFDRLRVLNTELKRLTAAGAPVALRLSAAPPLSGARLASALSWV